MRNKFSSNLLKKGLISLAAASVLATGAMAADGVVNSSTDSFQAVINSTSVQKGNCSYLTLNLLNENGKIDTLNGGNVEKVQLTVSSLLGQVDSGFLTYTSATSTTDVSIYDTTTSNGSFTNGVGQVSICYDDKIGTDTISVIGYIKDLDTDIKNLNTEAIDITVTQQVNQGDYLVIETAAPINTVQSQVSGTYTYSNDSDTDGSFFAGEPFNINVKAKIYDETTTAVTSASNQEGTVTLDFYRDGNVSAGTPYSTLTAEMVNGLATVKVLDGTLQAADNYYMIASMDTGVLTSSGDYIASNYKDSNSSNYTNEVELVSVMSLTTIDSLIFKVNRSTSTDTINMFSEASQSPLERVEICVADMYGNVITQPSSKTTITLSAAQKLFTSATTKSVEIASGDADGCTLLVGTTIGSGTATETIKLSSDVEANLDTATFSLTDTITASATGLNSDSIAANIFKFGAVVVAENNLSMGLNSYNSSAYTAGVVSADNNGEGNLTIMVVHTKAQLANWGDGNISTGGSGEVNATFADTSGTSSIGPLTATINTYTITPNSTFDNSGDSNKTMTFASTPLETLTNLTVGNGQAAATIDVDSNTTQVRFRKAGNVGLEVELAPSSSNTGTYKAVKYMPYRGDLMAAFLSEFYEINVGNLTNDLNVTISPSSAVDGQLSVVSYSAGDKFTGKAASYADVSSITIETENTKLGTSTSTSYEANLTLGSYYNQSSFLDDGNMTYLTNLATAASRTSKQYLVKFADQYGNTLASDADIVLTTSSDGLTPSKGMYHSAHDNNFSGYVDTTTYAINNDTPSASVAGFTYTKIGTDTLNITNSTMGVTSAALEVNIIDATSNVDEITVVAPDYLLTNTDTVLTVEVKDQDGKAASASGLKLKIDNVNLITVANSTSYTVNHGDSLVDNNSSYDLSSTTSGMYAVKVHSSNTVGAVTISVENAAGTKVGTKVINIVNSTSEMPVEADSISVESGVTSVTKNTTESFSVKVVDSTGAIVANKEVSIVSDNTGVATAVGSVQTDADGIATFNINASSVLGIANVTLKADTATSVITITVVDTPEMSLGATEVAVQVANQANVTVSNNEGTPTVSSSDSAIVTASYSSGSIAIIGVANGSATLTITDTDGTAKTITVTVESAEVPTDLTDATKVTDSSGIINADGQIVMSAAEAVISFINAFNSSDTTLAANTTVAGLEATTLGTTTFFKENGKSIFAINYSTSNGETTITISWLDTATARAVEPDYVVTITDGDQTLELPIVKGDSTPTETAMTPALVAGWNLLGNASNASQTVAKTGISITWTFDGAWTQDGDIPAGQGFWAKADADIAGYEFANSGDGTSMPTFTAGTWSLMAATMSETLADVLASKTDATIVWSFTDSTWSSDGATTIEAGQGYWVK